MKQIIEAISDEQPINKLTVFLAGGIYNCDDWQSIAKKKLEGDITIFNPRRENFPLEDEEEAKKQIKWEYNHLEKSSIILFWFAFKSLNPIVLYELGKWGNSSNKPIFVGCEERYVRKLDVVQQTALARPEIKVVFELDELINQVNLFIKQKLKNRYWIS